MALAAEVETAELPAADATRLEQAVAALPWGVAAGEPPHPDAFRYEVDLPDRPEQGTAVLQEREVTGDLDVLKAQLKERGSVEPARRPGPAR